MWFWRVILSGLFLMISANAYSCSCTGGTGKVSDFVETHDAIFLGYRVKDSTLVKGEASFVVVKSFKGADQDIINVGTSQNSSCEMPFNMNQIHLVRAYERKGKLTTDLCTDDAFFDAAIVKYLTTGEEAEFSNRESCLAHIKGASEGFEVTNRLLVDEVCIPYIGMYQRFFRAELEK